MRAILLVLALSLSVASCGSDGLAPEAPSPVVAQVENAGFILEVTLPRQQFGTSDAIPIQTTLTWTGAAPKGQLWGSGSGPVSFLLTEVGPPRRAMGGAMTLDCTSTDFPRGVATPVPFAKSGGWDDTDPNTDFYRAWFADPILRLPAGRWQLTVRAEGFLAPCDLHAPTFEAAIGPIELEIR